MSMLAARRTQGPVQRTVLREQCNLVTAMIPFCTSNSWCGTLFYRNQTMSRWGASPRQGLRSGRLPSAQPARSLATLPGAASRHCPTSHVAIHRGITSCFALIKQCPMSNGQ